MPVPYQIAEISAGAYHTIMGEKLGGMRVSSRMAEASHPVTRYVSPGKEKGALTPRQEENNEDRLRVTEILARNATNAFQEIMPPPPGGREMIALRDLTAKVARENYEKHPVKTPPFASQVARAYKQYQTEEGLYVEQVPLNKVYA